jgi:hypothetical protein
LATISTIRVSTVQVSAWTTRPGSVLGPEKRTFSPL